jgi:ATP-binding cassette subfamily F protein 3
VARLVLVLVLELHAHTKLLLVANRALDDQRKSESIEKKREKVKEQAERMTRDAKRSGNDKQAKQAASRRRKLERIGLERNAKGHRFKLNRDRVGYFLSVRGDVDMEEEERDVEMPIVAGDNLGYNGPVLQLDNVTVGYDPAHPVVRGVTLDIDMTSRIGFLGENGAGKSTLLATIAGKLAALSGLVNRHGRLRVGYYSQHSVDSLPLDESAVRHLMTSFPGTSEQEARTHLGGMGLGGHLAVQTIRTLSGGQRCRLSIALLSFVPPHILLLDEPTNHLDLQAIVGLAEALCDFEGGIVLVSHDRRLIREIVETHYWIKDGQMLPMGPDGLDVFLDSMLASDK